MDRAEALRVAGVLLGAHGHCQDCAADLLVDAQEEFPGFDWVALAKEAGADESIGA